jgi:hypothetical protein
MEISGKVQVTTIMLSRKSLDRRENLKEMTRWFRSLTLLSQQPSQQSVLLPYRVSNSAGNVLIRRKHNCTHISYEMHKSQKWVQCIFIGLWGSLGSSVGIATGWTAGSDSNQGQDAFSTFQFLT